MIRKQDWQTQLSIYFEKVREKSFKRGEHDCALFVCNCIEIMTGVDFAKDFREKYKTKKQAYEILKSKGYEGLSEIAFAKLGEPYKNINFAKRGDIVTLVCEEGISIGLIDLSGREAITTGEKGLTYYPKDQWLKAWEV